MNVLITAKYFFARARIALHNVLETSAFFFLLFGIYFCIFILRQLTMTKNATIAHSALVCVEFFSSLAVVDLF